ncbi:MAG: hypothetical protein ABI446_03305, partial [Gemmatimonadaceae bacterium]
AELEAWLSRLRALSFSPLALELLNAPLAAALGLERSAILLARLGGNDDSVRAQRQLLGAFGDETPALDSVWSALGEIEPAGSAVVRVSAPPSRLHALWSRLASDEGASLAHATVGRGIVRCLRATTSTAPVAEWLARIARCEGTHIFERLPADSWSEIPSKVHDPLSRAVRHAFDPARILNRGILGEHA